GRARSCVRREVVTENVAVAATCEWSADAVWSVYADHTGQGAAGGRPPGPRLRGSRHPRRLGAPPAARARGRRTHGDRRPPPRARAVNPATRQGHRHPEGHRRPPPQGPREGRPDPRRPYEAGPRADGEVLRPHGAALPLPDRGPRRRARARLRDAPPRS